jgi:hypothetical protein
VAEGPFPGGFRPGVNELTDDPRVSRPWLSDRHHPLLGSNLPHNRVPDFPDVHVEPGYARDRVLPTHFKAYTRTADGQLWADAGETYEEARWRLEQRVAGSA